MTSGHPIPPGSAVVALMGGFPVGGRIVADDTAAIGFPRKGYIWANMAAVGGQHLPQMYRLAELDALPAERCAGLGLCPACLGFGTLAPLPPPDWYPYGVDELPAPCGRCEGSGRIGLRTTVHRAPGMVEGELSFVPHGYVVPLPGTVEGLCLGCGQERGHQSHQDQAP